jgi:hypothetical protein
VSQGKKQEVCGINKNDNGVDQNGNEKGVYARYDGLNKWEMSVSLAKWVEVDSDRRQRMLKRG